MRHVLTLVVALVVGGIAGVVNAEPASQQEPSSSLVIAQARFKEFKPLEGEQAVRGEILKVDNNTYFIKDPNGRELHIKINEQTILRADFKPGDWIQAHVNAENVASVIKYMPAADIEQTRGARPPVDSTIPQPSALPHDALKKSSDLLPGHQVVVGTVDEVKGEMARVKLGDLATRSLPLKPVKEKGEQLKPGDRVEMIINTDNGLVDYHLAGEPRHHRIFRGRVAEVAEGVETALIVGDNGEKLQYPVQSEARSRIKRVFDGAPALFLVGEANSILDAVPENMPEVQLPVKDLSKSSETKERVPK
jgi:hypothetical protein